MKLKMDFIKKNAITIIVSVLILGVAGVSTASSLLGDTPTQSLTETTIEPTTTLEPTLTPTQSPIVTPLSTQEVINLDGVIINVSNSVINDFGGNTIPQVSNPVVVQPTKPPRPTPKQERNMPQSTIIDGVPCVSASQINTPYYKVYLAVYTDINKRIIRITKDDKIILDNIPANIVTNSTTLYQEEYGFMTLDYFKEQVYPYLPMP